MITVELSSLFSNPLRNRTAPENFYHFSIRREFNTPDKQTPYFTLLRDYIPVNTPFANRQRLAIHHHLLEPHPDHRAPHTPRTSNVFEKPGPEPRTHSHIQ